MQVSGDIQHGAVSSEHNGHLNAVNDPVQRFHRQICRQDFFPGLSKNRAYHRLKPGGLQQIAALPCQVKVGITVRIRA